MAFTQTQVKDFGDKFTPKKSLPKKLLRGFYWLVVLILTGLLAAVLAGVVLGLSGNQYSLSLISTPENTIVYLLVFYFTSLYSQLKKPQAAKLFVFTIILSFTINLTQGIIWLLILPYTLKKLKLISTA